MSVGWALAALLALAPADDGWEVSTPEAEGLQTSVLRELDGELARGRYTPPDALLIARNGKLVYERYGNGFGPEKPHDLRSVTKSITSLLVGIAIDQGRLSGPGERVESFFPETSAPRDPRRQRMTLEHLLTMTTGAACDDWKDSPGHEDTMYRSRDWVRFFLALPMVHEPGGRASYCTGGVVALGGILRRVTGQSVPEFAAQHLFGPLGITSAAWERTPEGGTDTGGHLRLRPRDLAKIGQMVLEGGRWRSRQVVPASWLQTSLAAHTRLGDSSYGYLWWRNTFSIAGQPVEVVFARGNGGQYLFVLPSLRLVAVFTGSRYNRPEANQPIEICGKYIARAALTR